mmetsp:Transcript_5817/g.16589  ORF Transcript_5817/g.16589 Transcript_5817/m.16589 type:complete len:360 (+) Transcript_5817:73-1152(+)
MQCNTDGESIQRKPKSRLLSLCLTRGEDGKVDQTVRVSPFVVVPGNDLVEVGVEGHACCGVNGAGSRIVDEIARDDRLLRACENASEFSLRGLLEGFEDLLLGDGLAGSKGEIDNGDISGGDTNRHSGELSGELGKNLSDGLGSSGRGRDRVVEGATSGPPVLSSLGRSVHHQLVGSAGVDGGHESLHDIKLDIEDLGEGGQAVGGARGVGKDGLSTVLGVVHSHHKHGGVGRGSRDDNLLGASLQVHRGLLDGGENTGRLADNLGAGAGPGNLLGIAAGEELDADAVHDEAVSFDLNGAGEFSVHRVVLELVGGVVNRQEGIVHGNDGGVLVLNGGAAYEATDAAESVDSECGDHGEC